MCRGVAYNHATFKKMRVIRGGIEVCLLNRVQMVSKPHCLMFTGAYLYGKSESSQERIYTKNIDLRGTVVKSPA